MGEANGLGMNFNNVAYDWEDDDSLLAKITGAPRHQTLTGETYVPPVNPKLLTWTWQQKICPKRLQGGPIILTMHN